MPRTPTRLRRTLSCLLFLPALAACGGGGGGGGGTPPLPPGPDVTPPTVMVTAPIKGRSLLAGEPLSVAFTADDDRAAEVRVVLDADGDPMTDADQLQLYTGTDQNGTAVSLDLGTASTPSGRYALFVFIDDGTHLPVWDGGASILVYPGLAGVAPPRANRYGVTGPYVVFSVGEAEQGGTVLNGDGDSGDGVVHVVDGLSGTALSSGLSIDVTPVGLQPTVQVLPAAATGGIAWHLREIDEGMPLNGDGDALDTLIAFVAPTNGVPPTLNPTGGATLTSAGVFMRAVVQYDEIAHGADLNGDGDALDRVVALLDYTSNSLPVRFPLQLRPGASFVADAAGVGFGAYLVDEATQGPLNNGVVLNLDGDATDTLVALVDLHAGLMVGNGLSNADPAGPLAVTSLPAPTVAFVVDEALASPGVPLNGDADSTDFVPAALVGGPPEKFPALTSPPLNAGPGSRHAFAYKSFVVQVAAEEGLADHNADLDTVDSEILFWADVSVAAPTWSTLAPGFGGLAGLALDGGSAAMVWPGWLGLSVAEVSNGADLNGDGDQADQVFLLVDLSVKPPVVHNTGIVPLNPASLPLTGATIPITGVGGDTGVLVQAVETANGDLNGDGDTIDTVLVYFSWFAPTVPVLLGDTGGLHAGVRGGAIAVTAYEGLTNEDHNGDGDTLDFVFRVFDTSGSVLEAGILSDASSVPVADDGTLWAFLRSEVAEQRDLNGDGDQSDLVLGIWRP